MNWCTFAPDKFFGFDFSDCCKAHDTSYVLKLISRKQADRDLRVCMQKTGARVLPWVYWTFVRLFGWWWYTK